MKKLGLLGYPLSHSFSASYFAGKFERESLTDYQYSNYPVEKVDLVLKIIEENADLIGLNVTIPYKEAVVPFLSELDKDAKEIGAVNTIKILREEKKLVLKGFNTDVYGFEESLRPALRDHHKKALILGTGGAAKAVMWVLKKLNIEFLLVSRSPKDYNSISYSEIDNHLMNESLLVINTSPLGMFPKVDVCPDLPYDSINERHVFYDLIYNPEETLFLQKAAQKKATVINGLPMLHLQAEKAWEIWNS